MTCRICLDDVTEEFTPCLCKGTQKYIHKECLQSWIYIDKRDYCPTCLFFYQYTCDWNLLVEGASLIISFLIIHIPLYVLSHFLGFVRLMNILFYIQFTIIYIYGEFKGRLYPLNENITASLVYIECVVLMIMIKNYLSSEYRRNVKISRILF